MSVERAEITSPEVVERAENNSSEVDALRAQLEESLRQLEIFKRREEQLQREQELLQKEMERVKKMEEEQRKQRKQVLPSDDLSDTRIENKDGGWLQNNQRGSD
jgi:Tfp pilus assembly protein PilN